MAIFFFSQNRRLLNPFRFHFPNCWISLSKSNESTPLAKRLLSNAPVRSFISFREFPQVDDSYFENGIHNTSSYNLNIVVMKLFRWDKWKRNPNTLLQYKEASDEDEESSRSAFGSAVANYYIRRGSTWLYYSIKIEILWMIF